MKNKLLILAGILYIGAGTSLGCRTELEKVEVPELEGEIVIEEESNEENEEVSEMENEEVSEIENEEESEEENEEESEVESEEESEEENEEESEEESEEENEENSEADSCWFGVNLCYEYNGHTEDWCETMASQYSTLPIEYSTEPCTEGWVASVYLEPGGDFAESATAYYYEDGHN